MEPRSQQRLRASARTQPLNLVSKQAGPTSAQCGTNRPTTRPFSLGFTADGLRRPKEVALLLSAAAPASIAETPIRQTTLIKHTRLTRVIRIRTRRFPGAMVNATASLQALSKRSL